MRLLGQHPEGRLIAGATELGLDITKRFKKFPTLISFEAVPELKEIRSTDSDWHIGAAVTLTRIEEKMAEEFPALGRMLRVFGSRQIRNRATMGGNIVTASPIGDSAPVLLALDAKVVLVSLVGRNTAPRNGNGGAGSGLSERTIPIGEFFVAYRKTALLPGEILKTIIVSRFPARAGGSRKFEWYKVSKRREMDISTVAACFVVDWDKRGIVRHVRLAYGGVAALPSRARRVEEALIGKPWMEETIEKGDSDFAGRDFRQFRMCAAARNFARDLIVSLVEEIPSEHREWIPGRQPLRHLSSILLPQPKTPRCRT